MVIISKISIISETSLEAEVTITDGFNELVCFSQPCNFKLNQKLIEPVYCFNNKQVVRYSGNEYQIEKLKEPLAYNLVGKLIDKKNCLIKIGEISLQLEEYSIPKDVLENEYIRFYCQRIDIY
ncbi:MAG: hypothetical protein RSF37_04915 [Clostridium sp.]|uniref:hypothetical protein n=1 Tax=Clostridium sp. TaxID=1506 RepID=UPI002FC8BA71